jgi:hypothetical protein
MSLGACFTLIAARGSQQLFKQMLVLSVAGRAIAVFVQLYCGPKWFNVAIFEGVMGVINGVCALLLD